jgi:hypothetical protein
MSIIGDLDGLPVCRSRFEPCNDETITTEGLVSIMFCFNYTTALFHNIKAPFVGKRVSTDVVNMSGDENPVDRTCFKKWDAGIKNLNLCPLNVTMKDIQLPPPHFGNNMRNRITG